MDEDYTYDVKDVTESGNHGEEEGMKRN